MTEKSDPIRESVREHYAEHARSASSCCGPSDAAGSCCSSNLLYPEQLLTGMPQEVSGFSLGCGDPITLALLQPGETVLDLGSGGGLDCFLAARQVGASGHVIGVDMTPEMLERARASAARLGHANVEFRQGYLESLPLESASVDAVISNCVINLSPDKPQVFREVFRVLKPGGRMAVSDIVTDGELPEELRKDMDAWGACVSGALDVQDYQGGLAAAGFIDIQVKPRDDASELLQADRLKGRIFSAAVTARKP